jgi:hypothetical protein
MGNAADRVRCDRDCGLSEISTGEFHLETPIGVLVAIHGCEALVAGSERGGASHSRRTAATRRQREPDRWYQP